jgi:hypothetical protein
MSLPTSGGLARPTIDSGPVLTRSGWIGTTGDAPSSWIFGVDREVVCEVFTKGPSPVPEMVMG